MRVAILGAGGVAFGMAAFLHHAGHRPVLWSPSGRGTAGLSTHDLVATGALEWRFPAEVAPDVAAALDGADVALVALPANGHKAVIDATLPHLRSDQTVIVSAQLSLGALYLARCLQARGVEATVIAFATTVLMGRKTGPAAVTVGGMRDLLEAAVLPASRISEGLACCRALFGDRFRPAANLAAIALSNLNPPIHMASALGNLTRIEKGEYWANYDGITPAIARLIEALDKERLAVAAHYGVAVRTVEDHYRLTFGLPEGMSVAQMAAAVHRKRNGPPGPTSLDTRFVTEDVPFGVATVLALAEEAGIDLPLHRAGIDLFSALYGRDFRAENDLLPQIDLRDPLAFN